MARTNSKMLPSDSDYQQPYSRNFSSSDGQQQNYRFGRNTGQESESNRDSSHNVTSSDMDGFRDEDDERDRPSIPMQSVA